MKPGPRPKPTMLRLIQGNPSHRPVNPGEPCAPPALPVAPKYLSPAAKREWRRLGPLLRDSGLLSNLDRNTFAAYCSSLAMLEQAEHQLERGGMTSTSATGNSKASPWWHIRNKCIAQVTALGNEFGLSPSSRSRVRIAPDVSLDDEFQAFLDRGKGKPQNT